MATAMAMATATVTATTTNKSLYIYYVQYQVFLLAGSNKYVDLNNYNCTIFVYKCTTLHLLYNNLKHW